MLDHQQFARQLVLKLQNRLGKAQVDYENNHQRLDGSVRPAISAARAIESELGSDPRLSRLSISINEVAPAADNTASILITLSGPDERMVIEIVGDGRRERTILIRGLSDADCRAAYTYAGWKLAQPPEGEIDFQEGDETNIQVVIARLIEEFFLRQKLPIST